MGFGWFDIRDSGSPGQPELDLAGKILGGVLPLGCQESPDPTPSPLPETDAAPKVSALHPNVPNPFNPLTEIRFDLAREGWATLRLYDVSGRLVRTLVDEARPAGRYRVAWNGFSESGRRVASGVYFYCLDAPEFAASRKMILLE